MMDLGAPDQGLATTGRKPVPTADWVLTLVALILSFALGVLCTATLINLAAKWTNDGLAADANQTAGTTSVGDIALAGGCALGCLFAVIGIATFAIRPLRRTFAHRS